MNLVELEQRAAYLIRGDKRYPYYDRLCENVALSRDEMVAVQNGLVERICAHAYEHTPYYRNIFRAEGLGPRDVKSADDLRRLPVLAKRDIRENFESIESDDVYGKTLQRVSSGGSSGETAVVAKSPYFEQMSRAAALRNNSLVGWQPADKAVWFWGAPFDHQRASRNIVSRLGIAVNRRLLLDTFRFSPARFPDWVDRINAFRPRVVHGYATVLLAFAEYLLEADVRLPSVEVVVSTTEKLERREVISSAFGAPVHDQYGCREILSVGIEVAPDVMAIADDCVVLNVNDEGEILLTALHSLGFPLINYRVGDYAEAIELPAASAGSLPFSTLRLKVGRITENFLTADGGVVSSSALSVYIASFGFPTSGQQIIQEDYRRFRVRYVADSIDEDAYLRTMRSVLDEYFGADLEVALERVDSTLPEASGKTLMAKRTFGY